MTQPALTRFVYAARFVRAYDGDTVTLDVDLGFGVTKRDTFRLLGVQAPEISGPGVSEPEKRAGHEALLWLHGFLVSGDLIVVTQKDRREGRGRYLAQLYANCVDVARAMVEAGHACSYDGRGRAPKWAGPGVWVPAGGS